MELVDNRAETTTVELPEGLKILTPEEVKAIEETAPEVASEEEQARLMKEAYEAAMAQDKAIDEALAGIGPYVLVRFEDPLSMRAVARFSSPRPQERTVIAVFERMVRELKTYEDRAWRIMADKADETEKEQGKETVLTREILKRGLPNNRATRRKLEQELGL